MADNVKKGAKGRVSSPFCRRINSQIPARHQLTSKSSTQLFRESVISAATGETLTSPYPTVNRDLQRSKPNPRKTNKASGIRFKFVSESIPRRESVVAFGILRDLISTAESSSRTNIVNT